MEMSFDRIVGIIGAIGIPAGIGVGIAMDPKTVGELRFSQTCFFVAGLAAMTFTAVWATSNKGSNLSRISTVAICFALAGLGTIEGARWAERRHAGGSTAETEKPSSSDAVPPSEQKELIISLVQYLQKNRILEVRDAISLNLRVQMQRQKYLSTNPSTPFNYFQFGWEVIYRAREGNWEGSVITPGIALSSLGVHEWNNEVSFLVRTKKMSDDYVQLKAFSDNLLLPPAIKWDLDQFINEWGKSEEAIADVLNDETKKGHVFTPLDQDNLQQKVFRRWKSPDLLVDKLSNDARQYMTVSAR